MKHIIWLLITALLWMMLGGCVPVQEDELGTMDALLGGTVEKEPEAPTEQEKPKGPQSSEDEPEAPQEQGKQPPGGEELPNGSQQEEKEEETQEESDLKGSDESSSETEPDLRNTGGVPLTVMVQNLRTGGYQTADTQGQRTDTLGRTGQANELYSRARRFRENVKRIEPDVILTCEGTIGWVKWFKDDAYFKSTYSAVQYWNSGGKEPQGNDSSTPILYKTDKFSLLDSGIFWYSDNPKVPSFFEEGKIKSCTWAKLRENKSGEELYFYSIHISNNGHEGGSTGIESMLLLNKTVSQLPADCYAFLGGDYNIRYQDWIYQRCVDFEVMVDLKDEALHLADEGLAEIGGNTGSVCPDYEREATGGNYGTPKIIAAPQSQAIDHLMAKTNPRIAVDYWGYDYTTTKVPGENVVEGYVSDHYALVVKLRIATNGDYTGYQRPYGE